MRVSRTGDSDANDSARGPGSAAAHPNPPPDGAASSGDPAAVTPADATGRRRASGVRSRVTAPEPAEPAPAEADADSASERPQAYEALREIGRWIAALPHGPLREGFASSAARYRLLLDRWAESAPSPVQRSFVLRCIEFLREAVVRAVADFSDRSR